MTDNPFAPPFESLPEILPVFPLEGVLLLPRGQLPLNIFEPRYRAMIEDALTSNRLIGMIQPRAGAAIGAGEPALYETGCAGKITEFTETKDGRYLVTLTGISRFSIRESAEMRAGYRRVETNWIPWRHDLHAAGCLNIDRERLTTMLRSYFALHAMSCRWEYVDDTPDEKLITCLSMICPFSPEEKQALLEAKTCRDRAGVFMAMLEMAVRQGGPCSKQ